MVIPRLTHERLREVLHYSIITGEFFWKIPGARRRKINDVAGGLNSSGYVQIQIDGENLYGHRLLVFWLTAEWPEKTVDHANRCKSDNRWLNVRIAGHTKNNQNAFRREEHLAGVYYRRSSGSIFSEITIDGKKTWLGTFKTEEAAHEAYKKASLTHFMEYSPFYEHPKAI